MAQIISISHPISPKTLSINFSRRQQISHSWSSLPRGLNSNAKVHCLFSNNRSKISTWRRSSSSFSIHSKGSDNAGVGHRRIWRRRKLTKKDEMIQYAQERTPFLEEQVRDIWETGKLVGYDIERLKLWEDNIFAFVRNLAAEANHLVQLNKDDYGGKKKAILHAISNRMNDMGFYRPEAYMRTDPFNHITKMDTNDHHH